MTPAPTKPSPYVLVVDDHPLVVRGLAHFLQSSCPDLSVVPMTRWDDALALIGIIGCPALLIADIWLADGSSLASMDSWRQACPKTPWLAVSGDDDPTLEQRVRAAGAQGFVHKQASPEVFAHAVEAVRRGGDWFAGTAVVAATAAQTLIDPQAAARGLTPRQGDILALLLRGLPNKRIASQLGITEATVKEHVTAVLARLGVRTRIEAITALNGRRPLRPHAAQDR